MSEPQDVVAEALEGQNLYHGRHGTTPAGKATAMAILSSLATRGYALVRTPETLDAERCRLCEKPLVEPHRHGGVMVLPRPTTKPPAFVTPPPRTASPAPDPGAGLAEVASRYRAAEWDIRCNEDAIRDEAHNARVEEWRAADAALAALLGASSPFAPSAEPPERTA